MGAYTSKENFAALGGLIKKKTIESSAEKTSLLLSEIADLDVKDEEIISQIRSISSIMLHKIVDGNDENNLLHFATKALRPELIMFLVDDAGFDVNGMTKSGMNVVHLLIINTVDEQNRGEEEKTNLCDQIFKYFMKKKVKINAQDDKGYTPLHYAVSKQHQPTTMMLVYANGINLNLENKATLSPLQISCKNQTDTLTSLLIENTSVETLIKPSVAYFPLHLICKAKDEKLSLVDAILKKLKAAGSKKDYVKLALKAVDTNGLPLLHIAVDYGHTRIVDSLFKDYEADKSQIDETGNFAIHLVAKTGNIKMLEVLKSHNALSSEQNINLDNPLHIAAFFNNLNFIKNYMELENTDFIVKTNSIPSIQVLNKVHFTPLLVALSTNNMTCFEILVADPNAKINVKTPTGNSVYHICSEYSNVNGLKYLFKHFYSKSPSLLVSKNREESTMLHLAAKKGSLEIVYLVYENLKESSSFESFLFSKNSRGQTFFHLACFYGHVGIVEFIINELKMNRLLEQVDNNNNTPVHLATFNGHTMLVSLLLTNTSNLQIKNDENLSAYDLSCRRGFSQISKNIINHSAQDSDKRGSNEFPLHVACMENSVDIVELLLERKYEISTLNDEGDNCLDIAIKSGNEGIIKILLNDTKWKSLLMEKRTMRVNNKDVVVENPQLEAIFDAKMWDVFEVILSKCVDYEKGIIDLTLLDRPVKSIESHPLMFAARSGQENIIKHDACLLLLKLKWRFLPRIVYYSNLIWSTMFLIVMIYLCFYIELNFKCQETNTCSTSWEFYEIATIAVSINFARMLIEFILVNKIMFLTSLECWLELSTNICTLLAINQKDQDSELALDFASWAVLSAFLTYPIYLTKVRVLGSYVVATMKTLKNSAKFLPIFLIILMGFILNFFMRFKNGFKLSNEGSNNFAFTAIKSLSMTVGDFNSVDDFSLSSSGVNLNWISYLLFLLITCVVTWNLFVGIAVSDIVAVLGEADILFLSHRITYSLSIQSGFDPIIKRFTFLKKIFNMNFSQFTRESEFMEKIHKKRDAFFKLMKGREEINLSDPQKRLEEMIQKVFKSSDTDTENLEKMFRSRLDELEFKLADSNRHIFTNILELGNTTEKNFYGIKEDMALNNQSMTSYFSKFEGNLKGLAPAQPQVQTHSKAEKEEENRQKMQNMLNEKFSGIEDRISDMRSKLEGEIMDLKSQMNFFIKSMEESLRAQTNEIQNALFLSESSIRTDLNATGKVIGKGFIFTKESMARINTKFDNLSADMSKAIGGRSFRSYTDNVHTPSIETSDFMPVQPILPTTQSFVEVELPDSSGSTNSIRSKSKLVPSQKPKK